ncbi:unnamed protein product [Symbiodinium microadriaticum]|nr:unnamed protein product [Symbiodinium sp. KB8]CAE7883934.1 unnamed protein product [Symbiodinium microadriaticum]
MISKSALRAMVMSSMISVGSALRFGSGMDAFTTVYALMFIEFPLMTLMLLYIFRVAVIGTIMCMRTQPTVVIKSFDKPLRDEKMKDPIDVTSRSSSKSSSGSVTGEEVMIKQRRKRSTTKTEHPVWIASEFGKKYHMIGCGKLNQSLEVTELEESDAMAKGMKPCSAFVRAKIVTFGMMTGKSLDDSARREQGLAAQLRAHRVVQEQTADGRIVPLAILEAAPQARGGEAQVALHPDSDFLGPLLQLVNDASCVEILLTAFTYNDPELTTAATAAKLRGADVRLLIDLQKAHACKEPGKILQQLLDSQVEVRTTCGKSLSEVYGGSFRGCKGALHVKTALIRSRASGGGDDGVILFIGSHNLTKASRANCEFVTELRLPASDTRVATYRAWYESMWSASEGVQVETGAAPRRRVRGKSAPPNAAAEIFF